MKAPVIAGLRSRFVPPSAPDGAVMVVLHGRGDSMAGFDWLPDAFALPGLGYLFLDAPDDWYGGYSWYGMAPNQAPGVLRSRALLFAALDALREAGVPSERIVLFGFSQGCLMSIDVALRYTHRLGGVVGVSGYVMFDDRVAEEAVPAAFEIPWLVTHGTRDDVLPVAATRAHVASLKAAGVPVEWHEFPKAHTIDPHAEWPLIRRWVEARVRPQA
jgi:phospholipase/carboxylesterase